MKLPIKMEDCKFYVNEEKGVVVCVLEDASYLLSAALYKKSYALWHMSSEEDISLPNVFRGKAVCSPDDVWNEDVGKRLAFYRMRAKLLNAYFNKVQYIVDKVEKELDNFVEDVNNLGYRMNRVQENLMESITKLIDE